MRIFRELDGNIGWHVGGLAPVRKGWFGLLPVPGAEGRYEWRGFLSAKQLPHSYNPARHFLASTNNKLIPPAYRHELGYDFAAPFRYQRIEEVLGANRSRFSVADFERLQHDAVSIPARRLTRVLEEAKANPASLQPYISLLTSWDAVVSKNSAAAALFEVWWPKLNLAIFKPRVPTNA